MAPSCFMITLIFLPKLSNILKTWQSISKKKFSLPSVGWICRSSGMADGETEKRREKNQGKINHTPEARRWSLFLSFGWFPIQKLPSNSTFPVHWITEPSMDSRLYLVCKHPVFQKEDFRSRYLDLDKIEYFFLFSL